MTKPGMMIRPVRSALREVRASADGKVYICNTGDLVGSQSKIQRIPADFHAGTPIEDVAPLPRIGPPPDRTVGNPDGSQDVIEFGNNASAPNAMAFRSDSSLFVSDSFRGAIFRIENADLCTGSCSVSTVQHDALLATAGFPPFGANGIAFDSSGRLWVAANQADEVVVLNGEWI
jgi:sugar lactone lactonase YvrE